MILRRLFVPVFLEGAGVTVDDGQIASVTTCAPEECGEGFLMPGLIDAHTHMGGRPDKTITDTTKIKQLWIDGKPIL